MHARTIMYALGVMLSAVLAVTSPVLAHSPYDRGPGDHEYFDGGQGNHAYGQGWPTHHHDAYGGYGTPGYGSPSHYGDWHAYGSGHPSGVFGSWGRDARHHYQRGHHRHHWF